MSQGISEHQLRTRRCRWNPSKEWNEAEWKLHSSENSQTLSNSYDLEIDKASPASEGWRAPPPQKQVPNLTSWWIWFRTMAQMTSNFFEWKWNMKEEGIYYKGHVMYCFRKKRQEIGNLEKQRLKNQAIGIHISFFFSHHHLHYHSSPVKPHQFHIHYRTVPYVSGNLVCLVSWKSWLLLL